MLKVVLVTVIHFFDVSNSDLSESESELVEEVDEGDDEEGCDLGVNSVYLPMLVGDGVVHEAMIYGRALVRVVIGAVPKEPAIRIFF